MNKLFILNLVKYNIFIFSLLLCLSGYSQINRTIFHEDFESSISNIKELWLPAANYSVTTGFGGNGVLFNSTTSNTNLTSSANIPITNLLGTTIAVSASIKGENLIEGSLPGMVIQLVATSSSGALKYYRIAEVTGTFDWKQVGKTLKIDSDLVVLRLKIGIENAAGKFCIDNIHIQVIAEPMPPARDANIPINKTHTGMYRGINVASNTIKKSDLDELSYNWKANSIRVMIGGNQYAPDGLLRADFDAVLQSELIRMDTLVKWCTANGLHMNVGLAGLSQGLFDSKAAQTRLINTWKLIAARYKNSGAVWVYDLANEPVVSYKFPYDHKWPLDNNILLWPSLADTLVKAIRVIDAVKPIMIESLNYSINMDDIKPIDPSIPNIIYSVHMYVPHYLTHQTLPGWTNTYTYPGVIDGKYYDKIILRQLLQPIKDYQEKYRVPIYIGEFSCIRWAPGNSALNYVRDCIELFEEYNWDYDYFAFREWNGWSVEHSTGYHDSVLPTTKTDRELLLRAYYMQNSIQTAACDPLRNVDDILNGKVYENEY